MPENHELLSFGRCQLNLAARELTVDGDLVDLQPLVFDLLAYFAKNPKRVIGKEELLKAVWRSPFVTDSVVTRAVMKARRAVMDSARAPAILHTVHRNGYRFDAQVLQQDQPLDGPQTHVVARLPGLAAFDLAVLPWTGLEARSDKLGAHMACLLHHLLERVGTQALVPMADVLCNWEHLDPSADSLATACAVLGSHEVVWAELVRVAAEGWQLVMRRGASDKTASQWTFEGPDAVTLTLQAVRAFSPSMASEPCNGEASPAYAQLGQALYLEQCANAADARVLADQAHGLLADSPWLDLALARLNWKAGNPARALDLVATALARPEAATAVDLNIQLLNARGMAHERSGALADACADFEQALAWALKPNPAHDRRPEILGLLAQMNLRLGYPERARRLAEQAVRHAAAMGYTAGEAAARLKQCLVLSLMQQPERASEVVQQAIMLASTCRRTDLQANAMRHQSLVLLLFRRFGQAIEAARKGKALYAALGDAGLSATCHTNLYLALIESDQFELALQERDCIDPANPDVRRTIEVFNAILDWKLDRCDSANDTLRRHAARNGRLPTMAQRECELFLARNLISLGQLDGARQVLTIAEDDPSIERPLLIQADLAFAQADRVGCMNLLRQIWLTVKQRNEYVMDACIDLAWLLMEDHGIARGDEELESLVSHILDYSDDYPAASLVTAAYLLRTMPMPASRARWDTAVQRARAFSRRYPHLATPEFRDALAQGCAAPLPRLLTRMCQ